MAFSQREILTEFIEAGHYGLQDRPHTTEEQIRKMLCYRQARMLKAQRIWIANPANREKKNVGPWLNIGRNAGP